jgi:hypothetical protein
LWKEAARTKAILSANQEASVNVRSSYRLTKTGGITHSSNFTL